MKKLLCCFLVCSSFILPASAQVNADFELGDFTGWEGKIGYCCPITTANTGIINGRHTIMSGTGTDPNTCNNVTVVAPGGLYSARVGNDLTGSEAEKLSYSISVTTQSALFIYKYAVVLEDPAHDAPAQPRFQISVVNSAGQLIDPVCGEYTVVASGDIPGFQTCEPSIRYKDWTTVGLDLSAYIGQTVTIEFATGDCSQSGHFGYAYVDAYSSPLAINSSYCSGSFSAMLTAPIGFEYLWSTGETTQSILVDDPTQGLFYDCLLTSVTGCTVSISTVLELIDPTADFDIVNTCYNNAEFTNTTDNPGNVNLDGFHWDFGDGGTSTDENPSHAFAGVGTYNVTFTISNSLGCSSTTSHSVTVYQPPTAAITYGTTQMCSNTGLQNVTLTGTYLYQGGIFESEPGLVIDPGTGAIDPLLSTAGTYTVRYLVPTTDDCTIDPATTSVTIITLPTGSMSYSMPAFCTTVSNPQSVVINGSGDMTGGTFSASPAGLSLNTATGSIIPSNSQPGIYTVSYAIPGVGCPAVNFSTTVDIEPQPTAIIDFGQPAFCNDMTSSVVPAMAGTGNFTGGFFTAAPASLAIDSATGAFIPANNIPGTYTITYMIPATGNCPAIPVTTIVAVTAMPTAAISYSGPFCHSVTALQSVALSGTAAYSGGIFSSTPIGLSINANSGAINPAGSEPGTYNIVYEIPWAGGCEPETVTTSVAILPLPNPILNDAVICTDPNGLVFRPAVLSTGVPNNGYDFVWMVNNQTIPNATSNTYTAHAPGSYSVSVTNSVTGCTAPTATAIVTNSDTVEDFVASVSQSFTDTSTLTVLISGGTGPFLYQLNDGGFQMSNVFYNVPAGVHQVSITDVDNCTDVTKEVIVFGYPKYFTPNSDGNNDLWNLKHVNQSDSKIYIFDRHGKLIKQMSPMDHGWDGKYNGRELPSTDYWFVVEFAEIDANGISQTREFRAHFALKR